jgi:hypothetical protein
MFNKGGFMKTLLKCLIIAAFTMIAPASYSQVLDTGPRDGIYDKTAILQMNPIPYVPLREADVVSGPEGSGGKLI